VAYTGPIEIPNAAVFWKTKTPAAYVEANFTNVGWCKSGKLTHKVNQKDVFAMPTGGLVASISQGGECSVEFEALEITGRNLYLMLGVPPTQYSATGVVYGDNQAVSVTGQLGIYVPKSGESNDMTSVDCRMVIGLFKAQLVIDFELGFQYSDELIIPLKFKGLEKALTTVNRISPFFLLTTDSGATINAANLSDTAQGLPSLAQWGY